MANPYASPFGDTTSIRAKAAQELSEENAPNGDDAKSPAPITATATVTAQSVAFNQFKKLPSDKQAKEAYVPKPKSESKRVRSKNRGPKTTSPTSLGWSVKKTHAQKVKLGRNYIKKQHKKGNYVYFHEQSGIEKGQETVKTKVSKLGPLNVVSSKSNVGLSKKEKVTRMATPVEIHNAEYRSVRVPGHRMIHIRRLWEEICRPIVQNLKLQIRMNSRKKVIELRALKRAVEDDPVLKHRNPIQKGSDFVRAVVLSFEPKDALALIRMDDVYLESFDIRDIKLMNKKSDNWMRAIGRIAGQYGKIKYSIENSTNSRVVIQGFKVHILGSFSSIRMARNSISRLVIGSAPGNVYAKLRTVSSRLKHKF